MGEQGGRDQQESSGEDESVRSSEANLRTIDETAVRLCELQAVVGDSATGTVLPPATLSSCIHTALLRLLEVRGRRVRCGDFSFEEGVTEVRCSSLKYTLVGEASEFDAL